MALARLDIPGVVLYGGTIMPGHCNGKDLSIQDVFEAVGAHAKGDISDEELDEIELDLEGIDDEEDDEAPRFRIIRPQEPR